jgi:hypothetical protein
MTENKMSYPCSSMFIRGINWVRSVYRHGAGNVARESWDFPEIGFVFYRSSACFGQSTRTGQQAYATGGAIRNSPEIGFVPSKLDSQRPVPTEGKASPTQRDRDLRESPEIGFVLYGVSSCSDQPASTGQEASHTGRTIGSSPEIGFVPSNRQALMPAPRPLISSWELL